MARSFNGTSDYIEHATAVVTVEPMTFACWFNANNFTAINSLISIGSVTSNDRWNLRTASTTGAVTAFAASETSGSATSTSNPTTGSWHHACAVFASETDRRVFLNGGSKGTNATSVAAVNPDVTTIGARYASAVRGAFWPGLMAEPVIWNVALTDAEVLLLPLYAPSLIRPESLKAYWPFLGRYSPEIDVRGGFNGTVTGATVADHPRVIYKRRRVYVFKPAVMFQFARPDSDITPGSWTPSSGGDLFAMVDEVTANDADRIRSNTGAGEDAVTLGLSGITTPEAGDVSITIRHRIGT